MNYIEKFLNKLELIKYKYERTIYKLTDENGYRRNIRFFVQRKIRGWDDSDTWSLDYQIAKFALPRLKRFKDISPIVPNNLTEEKWNEILDSMIFFLQYHAYCDEPDKQTQMRESCKNNEEFFNRLNRGSKLFGRYFGALWW